MKKKDSVNVQGTQIALLTYRQDDYISMTDMAKYKNADTTGLVIAHWMRTGYMLNFMGAWEQLRNPDFNITEFGNIKMESVDNSFMLSTKQWTERTNAIGIMAQPGRYGGTYAHCDIAFEFATTERLRDQLAAKNKHGIRKNPHTTPERNSNRATITITHPFHPKKGNVYEFIYRVRHYGFGYVRCVDVAGEVRDIPAKYTNIDEGISLHDTACIATIEDLQALKDFIDTMLDDETV